MKSLDLHGMTVEEAIPLIDSFLYDLYKSNFKKGKIITGKGTGKIQKVTIDYLKKSGYKWQYEKLNNGKENSGVIVVSV